MKHIKKYQLFLEENEFEIKDSDDKDIKLSKQKLNDLQKYLAEYNQKKALLDKAFELGDPKVIESEIQKILGKDSEKRNPFLVEYATVSKLKREVEKTQKENTEDKLRLDDFKQESSLAKDDTIKKSVDAKIADINSRINYRNKNILDFSKEIQTKEKELLDKMKKMTSDMRLNIRKISSLKKK
jgi:hypothetical protein